MSGQRERGKWLDIHHQRPKNPPARSPRVTERRKLVTDALARAPTGLTKQGLIIALRPTRYGELIHGRSDFVSMVHQDMHWLMRSGVVEFVGGVWRMVAVV